MKFPIAPVTTLLAAAIASSVSAETDLTDAANPEDKILEEIVVWGRAISLLGDAASASQGLVGYADFSSRPILRVGELVETMPGMVATQHSGSGKANQYFLRGMNLDHGTDFSVNFEGVPVNFRTHAHGQGYLDINFVIPELVETISYRKGTYYADTGDFSGAGSSQFKTFDRLERGFIDITSGDDSYKRLVIASSFDLNKGSLLLAGEVHHQDGPWELGEDTKKYNALAKYSTEINGVSAQFIATGYSNNWIATDQIPEREVDAGRLSRFGYIDPDLGGRSERYSLIAKASTNTLQASAYALHYELNLFSNPTYYLVDHVNGDQIEQADKRQVYGGSLSYETETTFARRTVTPRVGIEFRYDNIDDANLYKTVARRRIDIFIDDEVKELSLSAFAEAEILLTDKLRTTIGLRGDYFDWDVKAKVLGDEGDSGAGSESIISPKFTAAYALADHTEFYASYGQGFHSNDVRGVEVAQNPVKDTLVKIDGAELGLRSEAIHDTHFTVALFWLETDSELIFVGDAGTTEVSNGAERYGVELSAFWQPVDWMVLDITAAKLDSSFKNKPSGKDYVTDAHELVAGAGVTLTLDKGFTGSLRVRHFGSAPLDESNEVRKDSSTLLNLGLNYDFGNYALGLDVFNLLDTETNDIEFLFESQLENEPAPVKDIHFHPATPRSFRISFRYKL